MHRGSSRSGVQTRSGTSARDSRSVVRVVSYGTTRLNEWGRARLFCRLVLLSAKRPRCWLGPAERALVSGGHDVAPQRFLPEAVEDTAGQLLSQPLSLMAQGIGSPKALVPAQGFQGPDLHQPTAHLSLERRLIVLGSHQDHPTRLGSPVRIEPGSLLPVRRRHDRWRLPCVLRRPSYSGIRTYGVASGPKRPYSWCHRATDHRFRSAGVAGHIGRGSRRRPPRARAHACVLTLRLPHPCGPEQRAVIW